MISLKSDEKSYKAIVGAIVAGLGVVVAQGQDVFPAWVVLLATVLIAAGSVWLTPNPPK